MTIATFPASLPPISLLLACGFPDLLSVPGVTVGHRFCVRNPIVPGTISWRYVNIFEIEADNPLAVLAEIRARTAAGNVSVSDSYELVSMGIYEALGEPVLAG